VLREKELYAERERSELERQKNELREKELAAEAEKNELREKELAAQAEQRAAEAEQRAADAEQTELRKAELIMQERLEREKNGTVGSFGGSKIGLPDGQTLT